jgi:hypothetical protein
MRLQAPTCVSFALAATALSANAQQLLRSAPGPAAGAQYGRACVRIPDQNGDGYPDVLVGAPGFNQERGAVYCLSGAYLATGVSAQTLWSQVSTGSPGDRFGHTLANVGDVTDDGLADFLVGRPGFDLPGQSNVGSVQLIDGASHQVVSQLHGIDVGAGLGSSMAVIGDIDGDGKKDVAVGAPGAVGLAKVWGLDGERLDLTNNVDAAELFVFSDTTGSSFGTALAGGFDLDGDSHPDLAIGVPGWDGPVVSNCGRILVYSLGGNFPQIGTYESTIGFEGLGSSLAGAHDYDGDGVVDLVIGAPHSPGPNNTEAGRVVVLSGARVAAHSVPVELYTLLGALSQLGSFRFGAAVCASADLSGDGVGDILIGSPDFFQLPFGAGLGKFTLVSGATGARLEAPTGSVGDHLGDGFAGSIGDLDGDGLAEFVIAGSFSDAGGTDSGIVQCYRTFPCAPSIFCTGKVNSLGCAPQVSFSGSPSASSSAPFLVSASSFLNQKTGLLFYSHQPTGVAFQGGFKCAANPTIRTPPQSSGGSSSGSDCSGTYSFDFAAWMVSGVDPSLDVGSEVFAQYWSRDPASASHTSLSNAVRFLVNP